jgi:hypothetical protein
LPITLALLALCALSGGTARAMVDDSRSYALEAATPYIEEGFSMRYEFWDGKIKNGEQKLVRHQLFKGNEYWFWAATDILEAKIAIHAYDENGDLVEAESWQKGNVAAVRVTPQKTGTYFLMITVREVPEDTEATWTVAYAYR